VQFPTKLEFVINLKTAKAFGVDPGTVQRISRPFDGASVAGG
jgi:hypothetical protein